jgi:C-22 sterol desaturase
LYGGVAISGVGWSDSPFSWVEWYDVGSNKYKRASSFFLTATMEHSSSIPAVPTETGHLPLKTRFYSGTTPSWLWTTAAIIGTLLVLEQTVYWRKKRNLPGSKWTIPIIGKFADSMNPTLQNYKKQWNMGPLSCVSVFNLQVLISLLILFC